MAPCREEAHRKSVAPWKSLSTVHRTYAEVCLGCGDSGTIAVLEASVAYALPRIFFRRSGEGVFQRAQSVEGVRANGDFGLGTFDDFNKSSGLAQCIVLKVNASVRKLPSTIEAHFVSPARDREWTAYVAMPAPKEPLEDGLYSKFHSLLPWQVALHCRAPPCMRTLAFWVKKNSSAVGKVLRNYRFTDCWAQSTLAILFRPRGAERVQYEGIAYSQRGGIHHNLVGIKSLCVECHAPRFVVNGTAAVLTRGLSIVTVAVKPRGRSSVRHICYLTLLPLSQR
jgi:hypothetical protein